MQGKGFFWILGVCLLGLVLVFLGLLFGGLLVYALGGDWLKVLTDPEFLFAFRFSLLTSVGACLLACLPALGLAYFLARFRFPAKLFLELLLELPMVLPPLVSGVALLILFGSILGPGLKTLGISVVFTPLGALIAQAFVAFPFALKVFREAFEALDTRYEKIARSLGAGPWTVFLQVSLPFCKTPLLSGLAMTWARALGEFGASAMLAGVTRMKTETLSAAIFLNISIGELQFALIIAVILLFLASVLLLGIKLFSRQGTD